jgi:hypothetical protein
MEERYGVKGTISDGIFFTESSIPNILTLQHFHVEISRQNSNLAEVKELLAKKVISAGGNVLMNFSYGQKKHQWWELVFTFKWDTESWHGQGDAVKL